MKVEFWSDVVCPWCYIGKRRFEKALARFEHAGEVEVVYRSFELDPSAPARPAGTAAGRLASKYGVSEEQAGGMLAHMDEMAAGEGLDFDLAATTGGNTFDAQRLIHLAATRSAATAAAVKEALLHAYFVERVAVSDHGVLRRVGLDAGLPAGEIDDLLAGDGFAAEVRAEEAEAGELGATGVPFVVVDRRWAVPGAQDPDTFLSVLRRAWERSRPEVVTVPGDPGGACEGDSCAI